MEAAQGLQASAGQTHQGFAPLGAAFHHPQGPGPVSRLLTESDGLLLLVGRHHQAEAHPKVEGVPEIGFWNIAGLLQPAKQCRSFPAAGIDSRTGVGR